MSDDFTVTGDELDRCLDRAEKAEAERDRYRDALFDIAFCPTCDAGVNSCVCDLDEKSPQHIARTALDERRKRAW